MTLLFDLRITTNALNAVYCSLLLYFNDQSFCKCWSAKNGFCCNSCRSPVQFNSPPYTPPPLIQRSHSSPDSPQKHAAVSAPVCCWRTQQRLLSCFLPLLLQMNMRQHHMQQLQQLSSGFSPQQRLAGGGKSARAGSRQHNNAPYQHPASHAGRNQRYADEPGSSRHHHQQHSWDSYHQHKDRTGSRHHDNRGGSSHYDDWSNSRSYQDNRWRRYWDATSIPVKTKKKEICSGCSYRNKPLWTSNNLDFGAIFVFLQMFLNLYPCIICSSFRCFCRNFEGKTCLR